LFFGFPSWKLPGKRLPPKALDKEIGIFDPMLGAYFGVDLSIVWQ
jgi:hypothetical protein